MCLNLPILSTWWLLSSYLYLCSTTNLWSMLYLHLDVLSTWWLLSSYLYLCNGTVVPHLYSPNCIAMLTSCPWTVQNSWKLTTYLWSHTCGELLTTFWRNSKISVSGSYEYKTVWNASLSAVIKTHIHQMSLDFVHAKSNLSIRLTLIEQQIQNWWSVFVSLLPCGIIMCNNIIKLIAVKWRNKKKHCLIPSWYTTLYQWTSFFPHPKCLQFIGYFSCSSSPKFIQTRPSNCIFYNYTNEF